MADQSKIGTDWGDEELDAILADYFGMLKAHAEGRQYSKTHHRNALIRTIGRTKGSIEYKHMNISAVLGELGLPTLQGYRPMSHSQDALFEAVERYLTAHPEALLLQPTPTPMPDGMAEEPALLEEPAPSLLRPEPSQATGLERLVRKFDPSLRDARNRALGLAGEKLVWLSERQRLQTAGRPDLAGKVRWVAQEDGDGAGYDILSFDPEGRERLVEVKTTNGTRTTPFLLTRNEHALSAERPEAFRIFRVYAFSQAPRLFKLRPPLEGAVMLRAEVYRASFG